MTETPSVFPLVSFFHGVDVFEMEKEVARRVERLVGPEARPFDLEILYADEAEADTVIAAANTFPVVAELRLVVVRRLEAWEAVALERLVEGYVRDPSPTTCLIACFTGRPDFRTRACRELKKLAGETRDFAPLGESQVCRRVEEYFHSKGIRLARGAAQIFAERLGGDVQRLQGELEKVELFCSGRRTPLEPEEVVDLLERTARRFVFDLPRAIGLGNRRKAARLLEELIADGGEVPPILGAITGHYRKLLQARAVLELGGGRAEVARELNLKNPRWAEEIIEEVRATGDERLERAFRLLAAADARFKSTGGAKNLKRPKDQPSIILQTLLAELLA